MDFVACMIDKENALSLVQALHEAAERCEKDGRRIMASNYTNLATLMWQQYEVAASIHKNRERNDGDYII